MLLKFFIYLIFFINYELFSDELDYEFLFFISFLELLLDLHNINKYFIVASV